MKPIEIYTKLKEVTDTVKDDAQAILVAVNFLRNEIESDFYNTKNSGVCTGNQISSGLGQDYAAKARAEVKGLIQEVLAENNSDKTEKEAA